ncbi:glutathione binding-like protein [Sphingomonas sp. MMS12-HWE2-04]|uniref:glutathione binding-like protein n=1 Tax=Sphingomonas sp. MMS12-HWE2-04 TaxID=3234199 RepID=UPI00384E4D10
MIELYYWPTPNGHKITLFLEEAGLDYEIHPVNIGAGEQFKPDFLKFSPNNRMPAIIDRAPADGGEPISVFESGAILLYLANKTGKFFGPEQRAKIEQSQWLMWQMGGLGPMAGQNGHFNVYAPEKVPYAIDRYTNETNRLYGVLNRQLEGREFVAGGAYSIADMAIYPWIVPHEAHKQDLADFPNIRRWFDAIASRPATIRAYEKGGEVRSYAAPMTDEQRAVLFGQTARTAKA